mmetsp:Transcript_16870/g.40204  ORF Transcript_16870/g.40204 Transcript_16870/m.40204 type:complete len:253 (+) Transcript_16870:883-1641(+)
MSPPPLRIGSRAYSRRDPDTYAGRQREARPHGPLGRHGDEGRRSPRHAPEPPLLPLAPHCQSLPRRRRWEPQHPLNRHPCFGGSRPHPARLGLLRTFLTGIVSDSPPVGGESVLCGSASAISCVGASRTPLQRCHLSGTPPTAAGLAGGTSLLPGLEGVASDAPGDSASRPEPGLGQRLCPCVGVDARASRPARRSLRHRFSSASSRHLRFFSLSRRENLENVSSSKRRLSRANCSAPAAAWSDCRSRSPKD